MINLVMVYYHNKIGVRIFGTNLVFFEGDLPKSQWEYLLEKAI